MEVAEVDAAATYDLRRAVLREGRPDAEVRLPEDELAGAFHLAAVDGGAVVGVCTWAPVPTPRRPGAVAWRLRGMAVDPGRQGGGVGGLLLAAAVDRLSAAGAEVLWADGRDAALAFYERHGWQVEGDGFLAANGIPHHVVVRDLAGR
jgi:GNAT superfamily N-acetyltransferase